MRQTSSEITTLHTAAHSNAGMLHGARGSENPVSSQQTAGLQIAQPDRVVKALEWLTPSLPLLRSDTEARATATKALQVLTVPAQGEWIMARVAALLSPYYDKNIPHGVRKIEAEDWAYALEGLPQWAIENAVRWWKGADNPDRRKRPWRATFSPGAGWKWTR